MQDQVFAEVSDFLRPGVTDREVSSHAEAVSRRLGSDQGITLGLSAPMGQASRFLPRPFQTRPMQAGDRLLETFALMEQAKDHTISLMKPRAAPAAIAAALDD